MIIYRRKEDAFESLRGLSLALRRHFAVKELTATDRGRVMFDVTQADFHDPYKYRRLGFVVVDNRTEAKPGWLQSIFKKKMKFI